MGGTLMIKQVARNISLVTCLFMGDISWRCMMIFNGIAFPIKQVWKDVDFSEGTYQVSNYGDVRSLGREVTYVRSGKLMSRYFEGKLLSPKTDKDGYKEVCLTVNGERHYRRVHRLVGKAFVEGYEEGLVVDHKDAVKDNNMFYNLQWCSNTFNTVKHYSEEAGLYKSLSSLTKYEWYYIGYLYNSGLEYRAIAENLGLGIKSVDTIWDGLSGRRLTSITGFKYGDFTKRKHPTTKLSLYDAVCIIKERIIDKKSLRDISNKYNIAESMVSRFCSGKRQPEALEIFNRDYKRE